MEKNQLFKSAFVGVRPAIIGYSLFRISNWCSYNSSHLPKFEHKIKDMCSCVLPSCAEFDRMKSNPVSDHYVYAFYKNEIVISNPNGNRVSIFVEEEEPDWIIVEEQLDGRIFDEQGADMEFNDWPYEETMCFLTSTKR